jgi:aminoglycoside phosphotransferase (APT) family kinase protein
MQQDRPNHEIASRVVASTSLLSSIEKVEYLDEGYSGDWKYVLWKNGQPWYLLRLSDVESATRRKTEFEIVSSLSAAGINCPKGYDFGITYDGRFCYSILGYLEGDNAQKALPQLNESQQYAVGLAAGHELYKLHKFAHPNQRTDYATRRVAKYRRYLGEAKEIRVTFTNVLELERYVEGQLPLLNYSPIALQHDDYHPGNLIVREEQFAGIIDFNRCDWGDPLEDFYKVPWFSTAVSLPFARGQIDAYLENSRSQDFWSRYNLFVAMSLHSSLVWAFRREPEIIELWQRKAMEIVETHDWAKGGPPHWYERDLSLIDLNEPA